MAEEKEGKRASEESGGVSSVESPALKLQKVAGTAELNDDVMAWLSMEGTETDSMSELLKLLDDSAEATTSALSSTYSPTTYGMRVRFSDNPYSSTLIFQSSFSYITINGNEESCGSSFSESESSVMASVYMGGILSTSVKVGSGLEGNGGWLEAEEVGAWVDDVLGMGRRTAGEVSGRGVPVLKILTGIF
ncbi:hypothetical protein CRYUN_Cryun02cG0018200 [Craigia yunnanensis]